MSSSSPSETAGMPTMGWEKTLSDVKRYLLDGVWAFEAGDYGVWARTMCRELDSVASDLADANQRDADALCPWCSGSVGLALGGWPDANGYEREVPCPCEDGTIFGAFEHQHQRFATARAEIKSLTEQLAASRSEGQQDRERLDWLEREACKVDVVEIFDNVRGREGFSIYGMGAPEEPSTGITLRDAIDDGMKAEAEGIALFEKIKAQEAARASATQPDPRFDTGNRDMDRALAADDAKLEAMGAYDPTAVAQPEENAEPLYRTLHHPDCAWRNAEGGEKPPCNCADYAASVPQEKNDNG